MHSANTIFKMKININIHSYLFEGLFAKSNIMILKANVEKSY